MKSGRVSNSEGKCLRFLFVDKTVENTGCRECIFGWQYFLRRLLDFVVSSSVSALSFVTFVDNEEYAITFLLFAGYKL